MNIKALIISLLLIVVVVGLGYLYQTVPATSEKHIALMKSPSGQDMGTIELSETKAGVLLSLSLTGLTPDSEHAIHIHETGICDGDNGFKSAGGHYNPTQHQHGLKNPEGHHAGDMPNLVPDKAGKITNQMLNFKITLKPENVKNRNTVFDKDGSAIVIHQGADDHMSQPSGAAGERISCGVIQ